MPTAQGLDASAKDLDVMTKLLRHLAPIVIAVTIGPLIPAILLWLPVLFDWVRDSTLYPIRDVFGMLMFDVIFAYVIGGPIALLAGIVVSVWMIWREPGLIVAITAAALATVGFMAVGASGLLGPVQETNGRSSLLFVLVAAVVAAAGCWFVSWLSARYLLKLRQGHAG